MKKPLLIVASLAVAGLALAATPWKTEPKQSKLAFIGTQAGAEVEGVFQQFTADIQFDPKDLGSSKFNVVIDVKSVNSKDKERDDIIRGVDLFSTARFPTARYTADKFTDKGGGKFVGEGKLTVRDVTREVPIEFTHETDAAGSWLRGQAKLKRLDFGVGQGEWKDTAWVSNDVRIDFALRLQR
jgi:polyisoprenoid-binding protein YceI